VDRSIRRRFMETNWDRGRRGVSVNADVARDPFGRNPDPFLDGFGNPLVGLMGISV
jgi:hypothetical protein